ncbi:MAG: VOC family protein [Candidatus Moranbacteria bacterium]|nr:VOC family protein [Candidatus Moranbacteria bacterium]
MVYERLFGEELSAFERRISGFLDELGIAERVEGLVLDHVCLQLGEREKVDAAKKRLSEEGKVISSAIVNGREILIFGMNEPIILGSWIVPCVELPYPKPDHDYPDGWEHAEFVIPSSATTLPEFRADFAALFPELDIEELRRKGICSESEPETDTDQLPNPTIALRKDTRTAVKFHPHAIAEVVCGGKG